MSYLKVHLLFLPLPGGSEETNSYKRVLEMLRVAYEFPTFFCSPVFITTRHWIHPKKSPLYPPDRRPDIPHSRSGTVQKNINLSLLEIEPRFFSHPPRSPVTTNFNISLYVIFTVLLLSHESGCLSPEIWKCIQTVRTSWNLYAGPRYAVGGHRNFILFNALHSMTSMWNCKAA
jgi:hypothetical protein